MFRSLLSYSFFALNINDVLCVLVQSKLSALIVKPKFFVYFFFFCSFLYVITISVFNIPHFFAFSYEREFLSYLKCILHLYFCYHCDSLHIHCINKYVMRSSSRSVLCSAIVELHMPSPYNPGMLFILFFAYLGSALVFSMFPFFVF